MRFSAVSVSVLAALANLAAAGPMGNPVDAPTGTLAADGELTTPPADAHLPLSRRNQDDPSDPRPIDVAGPDAIDSAAILENVSRAGSPLVSREGYECKGSINCNTWINFLKSCDSAVNTALVRTDAVNYGGKNSGLRKGSRSGKCEVFIEGPASCKTTGNQMWTDYQDIRNHGCGRCGFKTWGEGDQCRTKIDFVMSG
ncbi:hypothetical protein RB595_001901 [Gaeumannomyces hyphopodioides]